MSTRTLVRLEDESSVTAKHLLRLVGESRKIELVPSKEGFVPPAIPAHGLLRQLVALSSILSSSEHAQEAELLNDVYSLSLASPDFGGLGFASDKQLDTREEAKVTFLISAYMESLNSAERSKSPSEPLKSRPAGRRSMTLSEKIFAAHDVERKGEVKPGDMVRVDVDWIMASELSWNGMEQTYNQLGKPGIFRNDRFWLAGDHVVDPRVMKVPKIKAMVEASERARDTFRMTEYQGMNYTIMHTEFCRERAQPGMLIIGSDSHTCSAGSIGSLAIGLGVADVTLPLITGETWFRVPESINIRFINKPSPGLGGKDVILYILKELKRNTVASDRVVEYTGSGLKYLSCDARFAISNMTTEFGGVTGIFAPDEIVDDFINKRKNAKYKRDAAFYHPDDDAQYALTHVIDLAKVESFVARYPAPDDVVPVSEVEGMLLDGCFIGACTTTEEDLVVGALVLEEGLKRGLKPVKTGKRKVVPGSRPILNKLRRLGLTDIYEQAGFEVGIPGCSYCVGMSADKAVEGETWLSSQNRNFENRMGQGAFGSLASSVTVAASSFQMRITDPRNLLRAVDIDRLHKILSRHTHDDIPARGVPYVEPGGRPHEHVSNTVHDTTATGAAPGTIAEQPSGTTSPGQKTDDTFITHTDPIAEIPKITFSSSASPLSSVHHGRIQRLGNFIDTDALAPAEALMSAGTPEELGKYCLIHTHPKFRERVKQGHNIVVAGEAFGCGSSRENAVTALLGAGVQCVIAKSFAFIYGRNQANLGLLGIVMKDERFYELVGDGKEISIDLERQIVEVEGEKFGFQLSRMERQLIECGGLTEAFHKWGKALWERLCSERPAYSRHGKASSMSGEQGKENLQW